MYGDHEDAMFARIFGKVCNRIKQRNKIVTVVTVSRMEILLKIKTERKHEGSSGMVQAD